MKTKLIIIAAAVIFIITVILLFYLHSTNEKEVVQRFQAEQLVASRQLAREIESYLGDRTRGVEVLSSFSILQYRDLNKIAATIQEYFEYVKKDHVKAISVYDEKGTIIYSTTKEAIGRNYAECDFFAWAIKKENKGKQFISSLIRKTDDQTVQLPNFRFLIAVPIYQETGKPQYPKPSKKFVGIVTETIDLEEVLAAFLPIASPYAAKENVWIMDRDGTLLFQSEHPEMVLRNIRLQDKTCFKCHVTFEHVKTILSGKEGITEYALKERPKKLAGFSTTEFKNISWKIVICIPYEEVSGFINRNLYMTLILIGIITLTLIGGSTLIYRSSRLKIRAEEEAKQWMEKRELEDKIRESEEHYRTMIETAHDIIWTLDTQGNFTFINSKGEEIIGHKFSDWIGKSFVPLILSEDLPRVQEVFLRTLKGTPQSYEVRVYDIKGKIVVLSVNTVPIYQDDIVVGTVSFGRDITEQRRAEEALIQSELNFKSLINTIDGIVWEADAKTFQFTFVSQQAERLLGYPIERWLTEPTFWKDHIYSDDQERAVALCVAATNEKRDHDFEYRTITADGHVLWLRDIVSVVVENNLPAKLRGVMVDITERKRAEALQQQQFEELQTIYHLTDAVSRAESVEKIYDEAMDFLLHSLKADRASILLFDPDGVMHFKAWRGLSETYRKAVDGHSPWTQDAKDPQPICVKDVEHEPSLEHFVPVFKNEGLKALAFIPLVQQGRLLGKFMIYYNTEHFFAENEIQLAQAIASHVAFAIERKRAEEAVRQSELQFRLVWEKSADGMRLIDVQGTVVMVNEAFCRMVGKPREAMVGKPLSVIYTEEQQAHILHTHQERFRARIIIPHLERELTLWNGKKVWFELSNSFFELEGHRPLLLSIFRDITEQKRAEEELHRKEEHHKAVIENIFKFVPEGVLVLTESLNLLKHNKAFDNIVQKYAPLLGYTEEELAEKITEQLRSKIATGDAAEIRIAKKNQFRGLDRNTNEE